MLLKSMPLKGMRPLRGCVNSLIRLKNAKHCSGDVWLQLTDPAQGRERERGHLLSIYLGSIHRCIDQRLDWPIIRLVQWSSTADRLRHVLWFQIFGLSIAGCVPVPHCLASSLTTFTANSSQIDRQQGLSVEAPAFLACFMQMTSHCFRHPHRGCSSCWTPCSRCVQPMASPSASPKHRLWSLVEDTMTASRRWLVSI